MSEKSQSARVREAVDHPIIDADGHFVEIWPLAHVESARLNLEWARALGLA